MSARCDPKTLLASLVFVALSFHSWRSARGQAWVDVKGTLNAGLDYNYVPSHEIVETPDLSVAPFRVVVHSLALRAEYVPIERLGVDANLSLVSVKLVDDPVGGFSRHGSYDDGSFHTTLTDARANVRYMLLEAPVALTPHVGVTIPVADYEIRGFTAPGRHLKQLHLGGSVGWTLDPWAPELYVHGIYEFSLVEKFDATPVTELVGQNRSDLGVLIGYLFLDGRLNVNLGANARWSHGGIDFTSFAMLHEDLTYYHDPLLDEQFVNVGGGVNYDISEAFEVSALVRFFVRGYNTRDNDIFALGLTWNVL